MTLQEKNQNLYQIYATLGELSVLKKQTEQRLSLIDAQVLEFEGKLVKLLEVVPKEEDKNIEDLNVSGAEA